AGAVGERAGADEVLVGVARRDLGGAGVLPKVLGNDAPRVDVGVTVEVVRLPLEDEADLVALDCDVREARLPHRRELRARELAGLEGELDVLPGQRLAVAPFDAASE